MQVNDYRDRADIDISLRSWSNDLPPPLNAGERLEGARRGLGSSRRFAQALTPAPLRLAEVFGLACIVRGELHGGHHVHTTYSK